MDVSKAKDIRNFMQIGRKDADDKKTDLQKQIIQLSKQDDSLAKMAQQKSVVSTQKSADTSPKPVSTDTTVSTANSTEAKSAASQTGTPARRFDTFVKEADQPKASSSGIYSLEKSEDGKVKIVTDDTKTSEASAQDTAELTAAQNAEKAAAKKDAESKAGDDDKKTDVKDKKEKEERGEITSSKSHFECDDAEHKANPSLHNENECKEVQGPITTRPATAAEE